MPNPFENRSSIGAGLDEAAALQISKKVMVKQLTRDLQNASKITLENYTYMPLLKFKDILDVKRGRAPITLYTNFYSGSKEPFEKIHNTIVGRDARRTQTNFSIATKDHADQHWEFSVPSATYQIHSKVFSLRSPRGDQVVVSSYNVDARSYLLNVESGAFIRGCPGLNDQVEVASARLLDGMSEVQFSALTKRKRGFVAKPVPDPNQGLWDLLYALNQL